MARAGVFHQAAQMRVHHLNCGTMCVPLQRFMAGEGSAFGVHRLVCHCLLIETPSDGLVLVDTGFGLRDVANPSERLGPSRHILGAQFRVAECARNQVEALGFSAADVRHIILTHLDLDHAGGLSDFPDARVHLMSAEKSAADGQATLMDRLRFRPKQWADVSDWSTYDVNGSQWNGFDCVRELNGLPPEILIVPLHGHTAGHAGVVVNGASVMFHCGDAYYNRAALRGELGRGLRMMQRSTAVDYQRMLANQGRLAELSKDDGIQLFCAHDANELEG